MGEYIHNDAKIWEKHDGFVHELNDLFLPQAIEDLQIGRHENILDPGCRNGSYTIRHLAPIAETNDSKIYALESSKTMHKHANENFSHPNIIYLNKDLLDENTSFEDVKIHKIFSLYVLMLVKDYKACLKKMYNILEKRGKECFLIVSKVECYNRFLKHLQGHSEFGFFGKHFVVPDWVDKYWNNEDHTCHIEDAVKSAGFVIERREVHPLQAKFASLSDFAECAIAGGMSSLAEKHLTSEEWYLKLHNELRTFVGGKMKTITNIDHEGEFIMDWEVTVIIAAKK